MTRALRLDVSLHARFAFLLFALLMAVAVAANERPFDRAAFEAAREAGKPVIVSVHADWCTTCRAQEPIVASLLSRPAFASFESFRIDFDRQKDVVREFGVRYQSTLIVFKGGKEVSRTIALTDPASIERQLRSAL